MLINLKPICKDLHFVIKLLSILNYASIKMVNQHARILPVLITISINVKIYANIRVTLNNVYLKLVVINIKYQGVLIPIKINCKMHYFVIQ